MTNEEAIEILSDVGDINRCCAEDAEALDMAIEALKKRPTGKWIVSYPDGAKSVKCNVCNNYNQGDVETYFCPNCGAKMEV